MTPPDASDPVRRRAYRRRPSLVGENPDSPASRVERYVDAALQDLPVEFANRLENLAVVVRREPGPRERLSLGLRKGQTLYGLYQGVPITVRGVGYHLAPPDRISIFWPPLVRDFSDDGRLARQVKKTVFHEIAHHFGISDWDLRHTSVR